MEQMARNVTDPVDGCLRRARSLMHDRDPLSTRVFGEILEGGGVQPIRLPAEESQSQRVCRAVRPLYERGVSSVASSPSAKGTCVSSWARTSTTTIASDTTRDSTPSSGHDRHRREPGRRRSAAGASGRIAQFLPPGGRMSGRLIKRTYGNGPSTK